MTEPIAQSLVSEGRCSGACMVGVETGACSCRCARCEKVIGKKKSHVWISQRCEVWCLKCFSPRSGSGGVHAEIYPECPHAWHDMHDHWSTVRVAAARALHRRLDPRAWDFPDNCQVVDMLLGQPRRRERHRTDLPRSEYMSRPAALILKTQGPAPAGPFSYPKGPRNDD